MQIEGAAIRRCQINFEIAGMDDKSGWSIDGEGNTIHKAVGDANGCDFEDTKPECFARDHLNHVYIVQQPMFFQFSFDIGEREFSTIHRHAQFGENPGQSADMIFMPMGQHNAAYHIAVFDQVCDVGNDNIHAEQFLIGEHQTCVNDKNVVLPANCKAVFAEFSQAAEWNDL